MSDINSIYLTGNLGQDPEIKYLESGKVLTKFSIANNRYIGADKPEKTTWIPCRVWGHNAEFVGEYAKQGSRVTIEGSLLIDRYQNQNGESASTAYVLVEKIEIAKNKD